MGSPGPGPRGLPSGLGRGWLGAAARGAGPGRRFSLRAPRSARGNARKTHACAKFGQRRSTCRREGPLPVSGRPPAAGTPQPSPAGTPAGVSARPALPETPRPGPPGGAAARLRDPGPLGPRPRRGRASARGARGAALGQTLGGARASVARLTPARGARARSPCPQPPAPGHRAALRGRGPA